MPEMRQDPISKIWTIIAAERALRPEVKKIVSNIRHDEIDHDSKCHFCYGQEHSTPDEVYACRSDESLPNSSGWSLRVVANKYAAFKPDKSFAVSGLNTLNVNSYASGIAEVLIESPHHSKNIALFNNEQFSEVVKAYKNRIIEISKSGFVKYVQVFRNNGTDSGASLEHPHSQIIGTPIIPLNVQHEIDSATEYFQKNKRCIFCDVINSEISQKSRIICENDYFVSFAPYASRTSYETWIAPKYHTSRFEDIDESKILSLTEVWKNTLLKFYTGLKNPSYNYYIHTSPVNENIDEVFHWHIEIVPKLTHIAGFEMATGMYINITIPEDCAKFLRDIDVK